MTFYETLSYLMGKNNVSKKQLSEALPIGKNQFKYWETNGNIPSGETLIALSDFFNCSVDYLLGRTEQKNNATVPIKGDSSTQMLIEKYYMLNDNAQNELLNYLEYMTTKPENLRQEDNKRAV